MEEEFRASIKTLIDDVKTLKTLIDDVKEIKEVVKKYEESARRINRLEEENEEIKQTTDRLTMENSELRYRIEELEQYYRKSNIIIRGVPEEAGENARKTVEKIASKLDVQLEGNDIGKAHRLKSRTQPRPIIARLNDWEKKEELTKNAKKRRPKGKDVGLNSSVPIIIANDLTRETGQLLREAKGMRDRGYFKFVWEREGKILIKRNEDTLAIQIRTQNDLMAIVEEMESERNGEEIHVEEEQQQEINTGEEETAKNGETTTTGRTTGRTAKKGENNRTAQTRSSPFMLRERRQHQVSMHKYVKTDERRSISRQSSNSSNTSNSNRNK